MTNVALLCLYDDYALGLRNIANALICAGHEVTLVHFKMPSSTFGGRYLNAPTNYEYVNSKESFDMVRIHNVNRDANMWTAHEETLLGDLLVGLAPHLIGISVRTVYEDVIGGVLGQMRRVKGAITVVGGHGATLEQRLYLDTVNFVCVGEGERAMCELADGIDCGNALHTIDNLVYLVNGELKRNTLGYPAEADYFNWKHSTPLRHVVIEGGTVYHPTDDFLRDLQIASYVDNAYTNVGDYFTMVGRGCVGKCTFCTAGSFHRQYREAGLAVSPRRNRSLDSVFEELHRAKDAGFRQIKLIDPFLLGTSEYLVEFFKRYKNEIALPFFAQFFPQQILRHPEILALACEAGLAHTVAAIQSGSNRVNKLYLKRETPHHILLRFAQLLESHDGLAFDYHLLTHCPFETEEDMIEAYQLLSQLPKKRAGLVLFRLRPYPHTEIERLILSGDGVFTTDKDIMDARALKCLIRYSVPPEADAFFHALPERFEDLGAMYSKAREEYPDASTLTRRGWSSYTDGNYEQAESLFIRAVSLDCAEWDALDGLGWTYRQTNRFPEAVDSFQKALSYVRPLSAKGRACMQQASRGLGWAFYFLGDSASAELYFKQSMDFTGPAEQDVSQDILRGLGWVYLKAGRLSDAMTAFSSAISLLSLVGGECLLDAENGLAKTRARLLIDQKEENGAKTGRSGILDSLRRFFQ